MKPTFWLQKWEANEIGFHNTEVHPLLSCWSRLGLPQDARVLVPLCGKSVDMIWLAQAGHTVIGAEISEIAAKAFFQENGLQADVTAVGDFQKYVSGSIEIWVGDFFALQADQLGPVDAIYDRAALIALPQTDRRRYADQCKSLAGEDYKILLIGLEYLPDSVVPPPYSMSRTDMEAAYGFGHTVEHLETIPGDVKGVPARETAYRVTTRNTDIDVT
ncbi:MAG: thiopurine S-methyltransferase [Pseudomonadota bacterium]